MRKEYRMSGWPNGSVSWRLRMRATFAFRYIRVVDLGSLEMQPKPIHVPDDMKGLKCGTTKSPVEFMLVKNWGAVPTPYDWSQLYSGLQSGVVEGQYVASPWQEVAKLHEVAKYFTEIGGVWSGNILAMDAKQYNALSSEERKWLHEAADAYGEKVNQLDNAWIKNGEDIIKASATEWYVPSEAELSKWREGAIGAWLDAKGTFEPDVARRVLQGARHGWFCCSA